jgi:hypothetical protein
MKDFLCGPGFAGLVASFGWTVGRNWPLVLASEVTPTARQTVFSTRQIKQLTPFVDLAQLSEHEAREARSAVTGFEAVLAVSAFDPATWTLVRYRAYREKPARLPGSGSVQAYDVQHVSCPPGLR